LPTTELDVRERGRDESFTSALVASRFGCRSLDPVAPTSRRRHRELLSDVQRPTPRALLLTFHKRPGEAADEETLGRRDEPATAARKPAATVSDAAAFFWVGVPMRVSKAAAARPPNR
jgi:hypothetical protein